MAVSLEEAGIKEQLQSRHETDVGRKGRFIVGIGHRTY